MISESAIIGDSVSVIFGFISVGEKSCNARSARNRRVGKRGFHPQASHRTVHEDLPSHGSCHSLII